MANQDLNIKIILEAIDQSSGPIKDVLVSLANLKTGAAADFVMTGNAAKAMGTEIASSGAAAVSTTQKIRDYADTTKSVASATKEVISTVREGTNAFHDIASGFKDTTGAIANIATVFAAVVVGLNALDDILTKTGGCFKQAAGEAIDFITAIDNIAERGLESAFSKLGEGLAALGSGLWNTAASGVATLSQSLAENNKAATEQAASLAKTREGLAAQIDEITKLREVMENSTVGSQEYTAAAWRLAQIIPGLNLSLDQHGVQIARLGKGYEANTVAIDVYTEALKQQDQASVISQLAAASSAWSKNETAIKAQVNAAISLYGANDRTRTGFQSLLLAADTWLGGIDKLNARGAALGKTQDETTAEMHKTAEAALASGLSIDQITEAMGRLGRTKEEIAQVSEYLRKLAVAAADAKAAATVAAVAEAGKTAAQSLQGVIDAVAAVDKQIADHQKNLSAAQKAEDAGWKAIGTTVKATYDEALVGIDRDTKARLNAVAISGASERNRAQQSGQIERDASAQKLAALQQYQQQALSLLDQEGARRMTAARRAGEDVVAVEIEILTAKRNTLTQIESDYRKHIDALTAEGQRHLAEVTRIEDQIKALHLSGAEKIRALQQSAMKDEEAATDRRRQFAELESEQKRMLADGDYKIAEDTAKKMQDIASKLASDGVARAKKGETDAKTASERIVEIDKEIAAKRDQVSKQTQEEAGRAAAEEARQHTLIATQTDQQIVDSARKSAEERAKTEQQTAEAIRKLTDDRLKEQEKLAKAEKDKTEGQAATKDGIDLVSKALNDQESALKATADAQQKLGDSANTSAATMIAALAPVQTQIEAITETLGKDLKIKLTADESTVNELVRTTELLLEGKKFLIKIQPDIEKLSADMDNAMATMRDHPVELALSVNEAKDKLKEVANMAKSLTKWGADVPQLGLSVTKALADIQSVGTAMGQAKATIAENPPEVKITDNAAEVMRAIDALDGHDTSSTHTIHERTVQDNASGGLIHGFASGGPVFPAASWSTVPGTGNADTVPAALPVGSYVLRKPAASYYGALLNRLALGGLVPAMLTPGERLFGPATVGRLGAGLFDALNAIRIPRGNLAAMIDGTAAP
uniref:hypothetical protein n=1 Tax=uncultured Thiodictyon sp. TaxID=1846217 RepID=UPI0025FCC9FA